MKVKESCFIKMDMMSFVLNQVLFHLFDYIHQVKFHKVASYETSDINSSIYSAYVLRYQNKHLWIDDQTIDK